MELALVSPIMGAVSKAASVVYRLLTASKNRTNFEVLANRIKCTSAILERLHTMGRPFQGAVRTGVNEFTSALDAAEDLVIEYGVSNRVERFFKASRLKGKFKSVFKKLRSAEQQLNLALNVEQMCDGNTRRDLMPYQGGGGGRGAAGWYPGDVYQGGSSAVMPYQGGYPGASSAAMPYHQGAYPWGGAGASSGPSGAIGITAVEVACLTPFGILTAREITITTLEDDEIDEEFNNIFIFE
ncbi:uncharacterized protein LOC134445394 isoform X2 [Engraulis encrasicolus]|uniref:uncharacterized protein LOC134445394 isoform X2 n=1 Tax=Engraulis encrasicolus TaxID=184585 RepID=UPI002FCEC602